MRVNRVPLIAASAAVVLIACERSAPTGARIEPQVLCEPSCVGVSVTPDGGASGTVTVPDSSSGNEVTFFVRNTSVVQQTYDLSCSSTGTVTCNGLDITQVTLNPNQQIDVAATFSVGAWSFKPKVILTATGGGSDTGTYFVVIQQ